MIKRLRLFKSKLSGKTFTVNSDSYLTIMQFQCLQCSFTFRLLQEFQNTVKSANIPYTKAQG